MKNKQEIYGNDKKRKIEFNDKDTIKYLIIEELE